MPYKDLENKRKQEREYKKAQWLERKRLGICAYCGKEDAFKPYIGCPACIEKITIQRFLYRSRMDSAQKEKVKDKKRKYTSKIYWMRVENGLCAYCGKRKPMEGKRRCALCAYKRSGYYHAGKNTSFFNNDWNTGDWLKKRAFGR